MMELMEKVDNLLNALDSCSCVCSLKEVQDEVFSDLELTAILKEYSISPKESLKEKIMCHPTFQKYKVKETELNLFIMEMNQKFQKISNQRMCFHENH